MNVINIDALGSQPPKGNRHNLSRWLPALALALGSLTLGTPAQAGTIVISNGGLIISTADFFLSIGHPVVIHQPVIVSYPVYHFPYGSRYRIQTYHPHRPYRYRGYPPLAIDDRLGADGWSGSRAIAVPNRVTFQPLPVTSGTFSDDAPLERQTFARPLEIRSFRTPVVLPDSAVPAALPTLTETGDWPAAETTERIIAPSPFNSSLMELQQ
jgi:hypothetical protein